MTADKLMGWVTIMIRILLVTWILGLMLGSLGCESKPDRVAGAGGEFIPASTSIGKAEARRVVALDAVDRITPLRGTASHKEVAKNNLKTQGGDIIDIADAIDRLTRVIEMRDKAIFDYAQSFAAEQRALKAEREKGEQRLKDERAHIIGWLGRRILFFAVLAWIGVEVVCRLFKWSSPTAGLLGKILAR